MLAAFVFRNKTSSTNSSTNILFFVYLFFSFLFLLMAGVLCLSFFVVPISIAPCKRVKVMTFQVPSSFQCRLHWVKMTTFQFRCSLVPHARVKVMTFQSRMSIAMGKNGNLRVSSRCLMPHARMKGMTFQLPSS